MTPVERFQALLRIPTVSRLDTADVEWSEFDRFLEQLDALYPEVFAALEVELVADYSLLFRWAGRTSESPTALMAHYDVVPAIAERWEHPPFEATVVDDGSGPVLWSRGAIDDKNALVAILEAVTAALADGFVPTRDVYLSFGHDEETIGSGAQAIVSLLRSRGIRLGLVLDEGGAIVEGILPGVDAPIAVIGVSERGIVSIDLTVIEDGGHASTPPRLSATSRLARALVRLDRRPFPRGLNPATTRMLETAGAQARQPFRWLFTHLAVTRLPLVGVLSRMGPETNAMVRTTAVATRLSGSEADNVLAERAVATLNARIAVGSSVDATIRHIRRAIRDPRVQVETRHPYEPSPISPMSGAPWEIMRSAIGEVHPDAIVTPYVQLGASDSRHFTTISDAVYRFTPFELSLAEREGLHAVNERIRVDSWLRGIEVYRALIRRL